MVYPFPLYKHESLSKSFVQYMATKDTVVTSYANISSNPDLISGLAINDYFSSIGVQKIQFESNPDPERVKALVNIYEFDEAFALIRIGEEIVDFVPLTQEDLDNDVDLEAVASYL